VGLPIGYLLVRRLGKAHLQWVVPAALVAGTLVLAPWLARNAMATGNPTFPFLSGVFGTGHFSPEQAQRFQAAHASDLGPVDRIVELWRQVIAYGFGDPPYPGEPWRPQWSLLPLLTGAGLVVGVLKPRRRRLGVDLLVMIGVATLFWLSATHLKSRFLVPTIPLMIAAVLLLLPTRLPPLERGRPLLGVALLAWCLLPLWLFKGEKLVRTAEDGPSASLSSMMVGRMDLVTGLVYSTQAMQEEDPEERMRLIAAGGFQTLGPLLAPEERVLALGNATPFLSTRGYEYATVWDEHPVAVLLERHPGDPDAVVEGLRARGTTLLLVNFPMLQRWLESGWLDPRLDPAELQTLVERLDLQVRWENGEVLYRVPPPGVPPTASDQGAPGS
ncbi:MAG: hypothetical protein VX403_02295, partial [Planctomycetota bacterium]|nr:hypothetical protein [Planctomycetota bacterium]